MKPRVIHILSCLMFIALFATACSDESGSRLPAVRMDMVIADVDADGNVNNILVDNGNNFFVSENKRGPFLDIQDARIRAIAYYQPFYEQMEAVIRDIAPIQVILPLAPHQAGITKQDPVELVRIWSGGGFLNIEMSIRAKSLAKHKVAFVDGFFGLYSNVVNLEFYHSKEDDILAANQNLFVSIPLSIYYERFQGQAFEVYFRLNTWKGFKNYKINIGAL